MAQGAVTALAVEILLQLPGGRVAARRVGLQAATHDRFEGRRNVRVQRAEPGGRVAALAAHVFQLRLRQAAAKAEGVQAGEQLEHHDAEREQVAPGVDGRRCAADGGELLGSHVRQCAGHPGHRGTRRVGSCPRPR